MNRILIAFTILLASCVSASAQLLWKISGNGLTGSSYVLGSHHVAPASMLREVAGLNAAISSVDAIYAEVEKDSLASPQAQQQMMMYAMAPADSTILTLMTSEQLDSLDTMLAKYSGQQGMTKQLAPLKPAMINTQLSMLVTMKAFPEFDPNQQFDVTVMSIGEKEGKEIRGFEDFAFQMRLLLGAPIADQTRDLLETIRTEDKIVEYSRRLAEAYKSQDLDAVYRFVLDPDMGMSASDLDRMLYNRNANWADQLKTILPYKSVLIVVGSGHLPGDRGLLQLLREQGYTVEPVKK